jgi:hypothetical protein
MHKTNVSRRRRTESEHDYLRRIVLAVSELSTEALTNLSTEAQVWYQAVAESIGEGDAPANLTTQCGGPKENQKSRDGAERVPGKETASSLQTLEKDSGRVPQVVKVPSVSDHVRRIILENLGKFEKKTLRELVADAGVVVANTSFDTIYYETSKTIQIAKEMGLLK